MPRDKNGGRRRVDANTHACDNTEGERGRRFASGSGWRGRSPLRISSPRINRRPPGDAAGWNSLWNCSDAGLLPGGGCPWSVWPTSLARTTRLKGGHFGGGAARASSELLVAKQLALASRPSRRKRRRSPFLGLRSAIPAGARRMFVDAPTESVGQPLCQFVRGRWRTRQRSGSSRVDEPASVLERAADKSRFVAQRRVAPARSHGCASSWASGWAARRRRRFGAVRRDWAMAGWVGFRLAPGEARAVEARGGIRTGRGAVRPAYRIRSASDFVAPSPQRVSCRCERRTAAARRCHASTTGRLSSRGS